MACRSVDAAGAVMILNNLKFFGKIIPILIVANHLRTVSPCERQQLYIQDVQVLIVVKVCDSNLETLDVSSEEF